MSTTSIIITVFLSCYCFYFSFYSIFFKKNPKALVNLTLLSLLLGIILVTYLYVPPMLSWGIDMVLNEIFMLILLYLYYLYIFFYYCKIKFGKVKNLTFLNNGLFICYVFSFLFPILEIIKQHLQGNSAYITFGEYLQDNILEFVFHLGIILYLGITFYGKNISLYIKKIFIGILILMGLYFGYTFGKLCYIGSLYSIGILLSELYTLPMLLYMNLYNDYKLEKR